MSRLVVRHHNPLHLVLVWIAIASSLALAGWGLFEYGRAKAGIDFGSAKSEAAELRTLRDGLQARAAELREQITVLERSRQVEREAHKQMESTVAGLQDEISGLRSELAFYRGIVTPKAASGGLRVQSFETAANGVERGYRFKLVLTQVLKNDTVVRGRASLSLEGTQDGKLVLLNFSDLGSQESANLSFSFRYFQNLEGDIVLPPGFTPGRVIVKLNPRDRRYQDLERVFDWPVQES